MGARYGSHFVRHAGDRGASLVDGSKTDFFDEHPSQDPGQSKRVVNIRHHRIWRIIFGCQFGYTCALHIEFPCLDGRTQRSFSTGCMCPLVIPFVCTLSSFVLAGFDTSLDRRAGWADQSISYCKRRFFGGVLTAQEEITFRVGVPQEQDSRQDLSIHTLSPSPSSAHDARV